MQEADYWAKIEEEKQTDQTNAADGDVVEISNLVHPNTSKQTTKPPKKRGRPKKIIQPQPREQVREQFSTKTIAERVQSKNRRVTNPGRLQLSPYKQI